jgi:hypothetical protein
MIRRGQAEHGADQDLLRQHHHHRAERAQVEVVGAAVERQQHGGEHERDREPHPHRNAQLAPPRQQHHHRSNAGEDQHEGGGVDGKEGDVELHIGRR